MKRIVLVLLSVIFITLLISCGSQREFYTKSELNSMLSKSLPGAKIIDSKETWSDYYKAIEDITYTIQCDDYTFEIHDAKHHDSTFGTGYYISSTRIKSIYTILEDQLNSLIENSTLDSNNVFFEYADSNHLLILKHYISSYEDLDTAFDLDTQIHNLFLQYSYNELTDLIKDYIYSVYYWVDSEGPIRDSYQNCNLRLLKGSEFSEEDKLAIRDFYKQHNY